ncbi:MAG: carboxypeptidase-like regulatory domain-containing protein [Acidobacteriota bacterium]|nr:carboxypeptidase-like regulatory domain-containing protein [Acidobacteriota bacterium]
MKFRSLARSAMVFTVLMLLGSMALAQVSRSSLTGLVNDPNGAAVSGAKVVAKNIETGEEYQTTTTTQGAYTFASIAPGLYSVKVEATGFKRLEAQGITIEIAIPATLNLTLQVGEVSEAVVVSAEAQEMLNTTSATLTKVISTRQVQDLPLTGRNPLDLIRLSAGISVTGDDARGASVGGLRGSATNVTQDGINAMDNFVKTSSFFAISAPSLNSTDEFSISVGTNGSESGRGVAQVRMVTKTGTNDFHGTLFWQHRNDALNANTFFNNLSGVARQKIRQNFFGGTIGGPIRLPKKAFGPAAYDGRDKSHFFFSYEGFREPFSVTRNRTVLTEQARQGIYRYTDASGATQSLNIFSIGNRQGANPLVANLLKDIPLPNNTELGDGLNTAGYRYNANGSGPNDKYVGRFDQQLLQNSEIGSHRLEFVYNYAKFLLTPDTFNGLDAPFLGGTNAIQSSKRTLVTAAIHSTFGSRMTNEVRVGHQRAPVGFIRESNPSQPFVVFPTITTPNNTFMSQGRNTMVYQYIDNFSLVAGAHSWRFGGDFQSITAATFNDAGINPTINIGTNAANPDGILNSQFPNLPAGATGVGIADRGRAIYRILTGLLGSSSATFNVTSPTSGFVPGATRDRTFKQRMVSLYAQDSWRVRRNFTFGYGVRWEFQGVPFESKGVAIQPVGGLDGVYGVSGRDNLFNPGVRRGPAATVIDFVNGTTGKKLYQDDWNNFAPFLSIAWSPNFEGGPLRWLFGAEGKTSFRGGYSISYLQEGFTVVSNALGVGTTNPGLIQTAANNVPTGVLTGAGVPLVTPTFGIPTTDAANFAINNNNGIYAFDQNLRTPYVQQWSFGIGRQLGNATALEVRYVGNHAVKLFRGVNYNEVNIFENGFLNEFLNAQKNLTANGGGSFAPGAAGTVPLPTLSTLFAGLSAANGFSNATLINNLTNNNVGAMAFTLANSPVYRANRANLTFNGQPSPNFFLANPNASFAQGLTNGSFSNYNSLQVELNRRMAKGLSGGFSYTFSKAITDSAGQGNSQSTLESYRTFRDIRLDRSRSSFDQTHRVVGQYIYELPVGSGRKWLNSIPVLSKALEGWQVGNIISWQTGTPITVYSGRSTFNQFNPGLNPVQLSGISFEEYRKNTGIFKTSSGVFFVNPNLLNVTTNTRGQATGATIKPGFFESPAPGTFGNFPRNAMVGPSFSQWDFSLIKRTKLTETANVEFRTTFYNAFNQANFVFGDIGAFDAANFGRITGQRGSPRVIHFILQINF